MKTASGQTQVQQKSAPEISKTAQKKKVSLDTLGFEDQRESSRAQADLQSSIAQSPRMTRQRKKMAAAFGSEVQRKPSSSPVVQRDPGDEPLVEWMQTVGRVSSTLNVSA